MLYYNCVIDMIEHTRDCISLKLKGVNDMNISKFTQKSMEIVNNLEKTAGCGDGDWTKSPGTSD